MKDQPLPALHLEVNPEHLYLFTTLLQSGIEVKTNAGTEMGHFLATLDGFTPEYIANTVETIFLNGSPVDDLKLTFSGETPVLALSAAMPGLAGAIFRKNSFHSPLRTQTDSLHFEDKKQKEISVTLKLFNSIAKERGAALLRDGISIKADKLHNFLQKRDSLLDYIIAIRLNNNTLSKTALLTTLQRFTTIYLKISA